MPQYWLRYQSLAPLYLDDPWVDETILTVETQEAQRIADQKSSETGLYYGIKEVE